MQYMKASVDVMTVWVLAGRESKSNDQDQGRKIDLKNVYEPLFEKPQVARVHAPGDLDAAWTILEKLKLSLADDDPEAKADLLDDQICFRLLTGKLDEAYRCLEEYHALFGQLPTRHEIIYAVLNGIGWDQVYFPSRENYGHHRDDERSESMARSMGQIRLIGNKQLAPHKPNAVGFPGQSLDSEMHHPLAPSVAAIADCRHPDEVVTKISPFLAELQRESAEKNTNPVSHYVDRLLLRLHYAMNSSASEYVSQTLFARNEANGDKVGMANYYRAQPGKVSISGQHVAMSEIKKFVSALFMNYDIDLVEPRAKFNKYYWVAIPESVQATFRKHDKLNK
ncbi:hypothetical protein CNMCM5623_004117 [Aspergillus felis]|uniref:Uncharacterized protein n=1 Tax=Aspergillus felis TaxID=1287682 RepID=A0A8H6UL75_9EURO|nr:hypothetical protein CNMCM5623_004117 [Aspergillus felis]